MIGVQLLSQLTCEMNQVSDADANRSTTKHRKIASHFRDTQLFEIFRLSCTLLSTARENCKSLNFNDEAQVCFLFLPCYIHKKVFILYIVIVIYLYCYYYYYVFILFSMV